MSKKIIVIGMDNTGKTTLCETLSKELGIELIKSPGPKVSKEEMENFMNENLDSLSDCIFERFPLIEEMVYGKILRHTNLFNLSHPVTKMLNNTKIIYCRPSKKVIFNFGEREQMEGVIERSEALLKQFDRIYKKLKNKGLNVIKYDYNKTDIENLINFILEA